MSIFLQTKIRFFFDFIYSVKSEGRVNGYYRVGRDDKEETIERISFELNGFAPSEKFINEINSVLNIELKKWATILFVGLMKKWKLLQD